MGRRPPLSLPAARRKVTCGTPSPWQPTRRGHKACPQDARPRLRAGTGDAGRAQRAWRVPGGELCVDAGWRAAKVKMGPDIGADPTDVRPRAGGADGSHAAGGSGGPGRASSRGAEKGASLRKSWRKPAAELSRRSAAGHGEREGDGGEGAGRRRGLSCRMPRSRGWWQGWQEGRKPAPARGILQCREPSSGLLRTGARGLEKGRVPNS